MHNNILRTTDFFDLYHRITVPQSHKIRDVSKSLRNIAFFRFFAQSAFLPV